jgi:hypothetical protein
LGGQAIPGGGQQGFRYWTVPGSVTSTSFKVSLVPNGLPVCFSSAGTNVRLNDLPVTNITVGTPSVLTIFNHFLSTLQAVVINGSPKPGASYNYQNLYVTADGLTPLTFSLAQVPNGARVAFESVGNNATITAAISGVGYFPITPNRFYARSVSDGTIEIATSPTGSAIIPTSQSGTFTINGSPSAVKISGSVKVRGIRE